MSSAEEGVLDIWLMHCSMWYMPVLDGLLCFVNEPSIGLFYTASIIVKSKQTLEFSQS